MLEDRREHDGQGVVAWPDVVLLLMLAGGPLARSALDAPDWPDMRRPGQST